MLRPIAIHGKGMPGPCAVRGCPGDAHQGKPYCLRHLPQMPYALRVVLELEEREREVELVRARGPAAVNVQGSRARELLDLLETHGLRSPGELANIVDAETAIAASYLVALEAAGLVVVAVEGRVDLSAEERARREGAGVHRAAS